MEKKLLFILLLSFIFFVNDYAQVQNIALGKTVTIQTNGADDKNDGQGEWPEDITDGSLNYKSASTHQEDGVIGFVNNDYNQLMEITITIHLKSLYEINSIRYNQGNVQYGDSWNADSMVTTFGSTTTQAGGSYNGAWTDQIGDITDSIVTIIFYKTRTSYYTDWLFIGEIEIYGTSAIIKPFLAFPLKDKTPYTATINSVFDHSMSAPYTKNDTIVGYNGERGEKRYGWDGDVSHPGLMNSDSTSFFINGHYGGAGTPQYLNYDGHPGYDYRAYYDSVLADADGIIHYPDSFPGIPNALYYHTLEIDHQNGFKSYYLHLFSYPSSNNAVVNEGDYITQGKLIGYSGEAGSPNSPHLHFEIQYNGKPVDPYGWESTYKEDPYTKLTGVVNYKLWLDNPPSGSTTIMDELNGSSLGVVTGITYAPALSGSGAVFIMINESRISYPFSYGIPKEGTLEWWVKINSGYWYDNYALYDNQSSAQLFGTDAHGGDVNWPGQMKLLVYDNGKIQLENGYAYATAGAYHEIIAEQTNFKFDQWHSIGISFGNLGWYINVDGVIVASDTDWKGQLGAAGNFSAPVDTPTIGQCISGFWGHNQYDGGFNGIVDRFRASSKQKDWLLSNSTITGVGEKSKSIPKLYDLSQNYPNPFNPATTINYSIPQTNFVTLKIYDILGREISTLVNQEKLPGNYEVKFDGSKLASGVYFYRLQAGSFSDTKKLLLLK